VLKPARWLPLLALLFAGQAFAAAQGGGLAAFTSRRRRRRPDYSLSIQTLLMLTALSFLPAVLLMMTGFTRIIIVLSLLRHALGTQSSPPNQVLIGLSLFLTFFVMSPTLDKIYADAYQPFSENRIKFHDRGARQGLRAAARIHAAPDARDRPRPCSCASAEPAAVKDPQDDIPMRVLIPAYVTSELKTAFQIGFVVFIPFLIIDMVVASVLMSMGMMMLSPVIISLPFKIMLFVLVDGWNLLIGSLVQSFYMVAAGPWMLNMLVDYTRRLFTELPWMIG
jgi:flagellar biosynthetic protein FliP